MTTRTRYVFRVKQSSGGTPWIVLEPANGDLEILKNGVVGFDLAAGITLNQAYELAEELNEKIESISYTEP